MTESRNSNARTSRKGKVQIYINEDMFDAVMDLQDTNPVKMLEYIKTLKRANLKDDGEVKMQLTKQQIEALKGKCSCICHTYPAQDKGKHVEFSRGRLSGSVDCPRCVGTGQATIEIEKEWVECLNCKGLGVLERIQGSERKCIDCKGKGKIPKFKVGDGIDICEICGRLNQKHSRFYDDHNFKSVKLKIISETEDKWIAIEVR